MRLIIGLGVILVAAVITILSLLFTQNAGAGQTADFARYAQLGIIQRLTDIYGKNGIPYTVKCIEKDSFNQLTGVNDVITCRVASK